MFKANASTTAAIFSARICSNTATCSKGLSQSSVNVSIYGTTLSALIDPVNSDSFISQAVAEKQTEDSHVDTKYFYGSHFSEDTRH